MSIRERLSGNEAAAIAMKQINPDVVAAFPITPSTEIPQYFSTFVNNGQVDTLGEYFDYDMFNKAEVAKYTATVPTMRSTPTPRQLKRCAGIPVLTSYRSVSRTRR